MRKFCSLRSALCFAITGLVLAVSIATPVAAVRDLPAGPGETAVLSFAFYLPPVSSIGPIDDSFGIALGDLDGDSDLDLYSATNAINRVYLNNGTGVYTLYDSSVEADKSRDVALGDLDGDGDLDAYVANNQGPNRVYLNDGSGRFTLGSSSTEADDSLGVSLGDVDGDGDLDVCVANMGDPNRVYTNDGSGVLSLLYSTAESDYSWDLALGDLDGDADLDMYAANYYPAIGASFPNRVYRNNGDGTFNLAGIAAETADKSHGVALGDLDGDGDLDAYVSNEGANRTYMNDGSGSFALASSSAEGESNDAALGDLDGDGDLDVYVANEGQNLVYINNGAGVLTLSESSAETDDSYAVALGDVDRDTDLDVCVANFNQVNRIYMNAGPPLISGISPASAHRGSVVAIVISGSHLIGDPGLDFGAGINVFGVTYSSPNRYDAIIQVAADAAPGPRDVSVANPGGNNTLVSGFLVTEPAPPPVYIEPSYPVNLNVAGAGGSLVLDIYSKISRTVEVTAPGGLLHLKFPARTFALQQNGQKITSLDVTVNADPPPPPAGKNVIGIVYDFQPDGAVFAPPIMLTLSYGPEDIPSGADEIDLVLAFYDDATMKWVECPTLIDTEKSTLTCPVSHFTNFAVLAPLLDTVPTPFEEPELTPTSKPQPTSLVFTLSALAVQPCEVETGQEVTVSVLLANTGSTDGGCTVFLDINGERETEKLVTIEAGGSELVVFPVSRHQAGQYSVAVNGLESSFVVALPGTENPGTATIETVSSTISAQVTLPPAAKGSAFEWYIIVIIVGAIVAAGLLLLVWLRRR